MSDLDLLLAVAGAVVTLFVVAGMVLITPRGQVEEAPDHGATAGAEASPAPGSALESDHDRRRPNPAVATIVEPGVRVDGVAGDLRPV